MPAAPHTPTCRSSCATSTSSRPPTQATCTRAAEPSGGRPARCPGGTIDLVMRYESLAAVAAETTERVGRVLVRGDAQERVWATWLLAQRDAGMAVDRIGVAFEHEREVGVRRHMLVVLAGLGRRDVVRHTAAHEPAPLLRAEAARYLARLSEPSDVDAHEVLGARAIDIAPHVRAAIADATRADAPRGMVERVVGLLFDPDPDVRAVARDRFERGDFPRAPVADALAALDRI